MELKEFTIIDASFQRFYKKADEFIEQAKEYYLKKELENGRDIKELRKKAAYSPIA